MDIRKNLQKARQQKLLLRRALLAAATLEKSYEDLLALEGEPVISLRAATKQALEASTGPMHIKEILARVEALGAQVRSARGDKLSRVDLGIVSLKRWGFPVVRVATRTWLYQKSG